jgi:hypothetical protein
MIMKLKKQRPGPTGVVEPVKKNKLKTRRDLEVLHLD